MFHNIGPWFSSKTFKTSDLNRLFFFKTFFRFKTTKNCFHFTEKKTFQFSLLHFCQNRAFLLFLSFWGSKKVSLSVLLELLFFSSPLALRRNRLERLSLASLLLLAVKAGSLPLWCGPQVCSRSNVIKLLLSMI
jgi:hypothetical protein